MEKTATQVYALAEVNRQLLEEGVVERIVALAASESKGQWGSPEDDKTGAIKLLLDAAGKMIADHPRLPTCCNQCLAAEAARYMEVLMHVIFAEVHANSETEGKDADS